MMKKRRRSKPSFREYLQRVKLKRFASFPIKHISNIDPGTTSSGEEERKDTTQVFWFFRQRLLPRTSFFRGWPSELTHSPVLPPLCRAGTQRHAAVAQNGDRQKTNVTLRDARLGGAPPTTLGECASRRTAGGGDATPGASAGGARAPLGAANSVGP